MLSALLLSLSVSALPAQPACTIASGCGECYHTGRPGHVIWDGQYSDCFPCGGLTATPDQRVAGHEGIPKTVPTGKDGRRNA